MANLNKVMLIGRLTRDPESRAFSNGGKVTKFGFAVNNRKKNNQTGQWEDDPVFIDVEVFNRGESLQADRVADTLRKGQQVFIEGHLKLDQWEKDGQKRSQLKVVCDNFQYLEPRQDGGEGGGTRAPRMASTGSGPARKSFAPANAGFNEPEPEPMEQVDEDGNIPF